ncbi:MATE family efflux transporter [Paramaledivibacter caminithermalis]|jgi:putative MATE family efflux protein|uniref:Probable multidrug resistance protein NorM n=1 Tax=Paramaledivibacter caminithermalis (strain DSM 15212 / CIP 107654 / DViRD3) TaxID=1121301 RepID=A0A1M6MSG7_PARC5|nr:MATE family efflux transporter [Paramaledivibacter caminithermalis]SHJ86339.1 putative efflux protein, MATE family [Paramaledivibacter caminithermalis DSM 15212]
MKQNKHEYIIKGPILGSLLKLALPLMVGQLIQTLYNLVDTLWVGKLGSEAVAAVSISFPIVFLMISLAAGLTIAGTALIAQNKGAGNNDKVDRILGQLFGFVGMLSIILALIGFVFSKQFIVWMGAQPQIIDDASGYLRIIFSGIPFMFIFFIFSASLRGIGDTMTPMLMTLFSATINVILDPLLIFGIGFFPKMGVQGAALATIISRAIAALYGLAILISGKKNLHLKFRYLKPNIKIIKKVVIIGIPSSVQQSMLSMAQILMTSIVANFGTTTLAAYGIGNRIVSIASMLAMGISTATTTMVGQNIGAGEKDRAERISKVSMGLTFSLLTFLGIVIFIVPEQIVGVFNKEAEVLLYGSSYMRITALFLGTMGVRMVNNGTLRGAGKTIATMIISIMAFCVLRIPLSYIFAYFFNLNQTGIWWGIAVSDGLSAFISIAWLKLSNWSKNILVEKNESNKDHIDIT